MNGRYTVSDFYKAFESQLRQVAGAGGMSREITDAGIMDYEIDPVLKNKIFYTKSDSYTIDNGSDFSCEVIP